MGEHIHSVSAAARSIANPLFKGFWAEQINQQKKRAAARGSTPNDRFIESLETRLFLSVSWLDPNSVATWNASTKILDVTGQATIIADPGADEPIIEVSGSSASVTISPGDDTFVHIGGLNLTGGATVAVSSITGGATEQNHYVLVVGQENAASTPTFSIDSASKLDLADNDLIIHHGNLAAVQAALAEGRNVTPGGDADGVWTGDGLTSSVAAANDAAAGTEKFALAAGLNSDLSTELTAWTVGGISEPLRNDGGDVLVKFTLNGDVNLDGKVNSKDQSILESNEDGSNGYDYLNGDLNGDGIVDTNDVNAQAQFLTDKLTISPAAPTAFTAALDPTDPRTTIDLSWTAATTVPDHYVLETSTTGTNFTDSTATIPGSATSYTDSGLSSGTAYWFRLRAVYSDGTFSIAPSASGQTAVIPSVTTAIATPGIAVVSATWDWQDPANALTVQFNQPIAISTPVPNAPFSNVLPGTLILENTTTGQVLTTSDMQCGYTLATNTAIWTFPNQNGTAFAPGALSNGWWVATISFQSITSAAGNLHLNQDLSVNCPVLRGDAFHNLSTNSAGEEQILVSLADYNLVLANFNLSGATYTQGSFDYSGNVGLGAYNLVTAELNATLTAPPTTPGGISVSNVFATSPTDTTPQTELDLNWNPPTTPPGSPTITGYQIQRSADGESFSAIPQTGTVNPSDLPFGTNNYTDTGLTAGNRYWYRVRAIYSDGTFSAYSAKQALNTIMAPPTATVSTSGTTIALASESASQLNASTLNYTWIATSLPTGAPAPTYSDNDTTTALSANATVGALGTYEFQVTITTTGGVVVSVGTVQAIVIQVPTLAQLPQIVPKIFFCGDENRPALIVARGRTAKSRCSA